MSLTSVRHFQAKITVLILKKARKGKPHMKYTSAFRLFFSHGSVAISGATSQMTTDAIL